MNYTPISPREFEISNLAFGKLSSESIAEHIGLYNAYITNANTILKTLNELSPDIGGYAILRSEILRRFSFEYNGIINHEKFFEQFTGTAGESLESSRLKSLIESEWGSFESWKEDFVTTAKTRGVGWAILYYDNNSQRLYNTWVDEQHIGHLNSCDFILGIDMWEHSFVADYAPSGKATYITDALNAINWSIISQRLS